MPLYDCVLLLKSNVTKESLMNLVARVGKHVSQRNGVLTDVKSFGSVHLGYGIKKLDGKHYKGQLFQMTMMATPNFNKELQYLNKEDRLLRWVLVKHRDTKHGEGFLNEEGGKNELLRIRSNKISDDDSDVDDNDDEDNKMQNTTGQHFFPFTK